MEFKKIVLRRPEEVENLCKELRNKCRVAVDTETEEIIGEFHPINHTKCFSIQFTYEEGTGIFVPTYNDYRVNLNILKPYLEDSKRSKVFHNYSFDCHVLLNEGIKFRGLYADTWVMNYTAFNDKMDENGGIVKRGLKELCNKYFGYTLKSYDEEFVERTGKNKRTKILQNLVDVVRTIGGEDRIVDYAVKDTVLTWKLFDWEKSRLDNQEWLARSRKGKSMWDYYQELEVRFAECLVEIERNGLHMNRESLDNLDIHFAAEQKRLRQVWRNTLLEYDCKDDLNHSSNDDVVKFFEEYVKLRLTKRTKSGEAFSVDAKALEDLMHPVAQLILDMRKVDKGKGTYTETLKKCYEAYNGYVHTHYNQCGTRTGRLSCSNPNLANQPSRGELGKQIELCFDAPEGREVGASDMSQIEIRIGAMFSGDKATKRMIDNNWDSHSFTTTAISPEVKRWIGNREITKSLLDEVAVRFGDERKKAKNVNFASQYGAGGAKVALMCKVPEPEGKAMVAAYWDMHKELKAYKDKIGKQADKDGYVTTILGRRIWLSGTRFTHDNPDIQKSIRAKAQRQASNSAIQGTVADLMKLAMIYMVENEDLKKDDVRVTCSIYDALYFDAPVGSLEKHKKIIDEIMSEPLKVFCGAKLSMSTPAELFTGKTVYEAKHKG